MRLITRVYRHFATDPLYRNSIYLMLSTAVMSVFGFVFWIINTRLFTTEQIGLATTMISAGSLITSFSLLGLNTGLIRYLSKAERKNDIINTVISATSLTTVIISFLFISGLTVFSPKLIFIRQNTFRSLSYIMFVVIFGLNSLIESIFIAFRDTKFIFIKNSVFSAIKLIVPFLFINLGTYGVFGSIAVSLTVSTAYSLMILIKKFNYSPRFIIDKIVVKKIAWFSFATYINGFLGSLPTMILPLMIVNIIGPKAAAYYYIATMIAGILFIIPQAVTQSFFAEGSHNENNLLEITVKSSKIIALLLIPAIIFTLFFGKYILIAFGKDYSSESLRLLQMLALSGIFMSINSVFSTILLVQHRILNMIIMSILNIIFTLGLTYLWINYGLSGIGAAWIIGQAAVSLVFILLKVTNYLKIADQVNPDYGRIN